MRHAATACTVLLFTGLLLGQQVAAATNPPNWPSAFDAVSIRPVDTRRPLRWTGLRSESGGRLTAIASALDLIMFACNVRAYQIEGLPDWSKKSLFSIQAVAPPGAPSLPPLQNNAMERPMVLAMLQQEFQMRFHRETRTIDVLALVVAKGGAKLRQATGDELAALNSSSPNSNRRKTGMSAGMFSSIAGQMDELAGGLSFDLQTPVIDKTNMTGFYDFTLTWAPGPGELMRGGKRSAGPSIFSALQSQLGLRLKSAKGPVNMIAIDHIAPPKTAY